MTASSHSAQCSIHSHASCASRSSQPSLLQIYLGLLRKAVSESELLTKVDLGLGLIELVVVSLGSNFEIVFSQRECLYLGLLLCRLDILRWTCIASEISVSKSSKWKRGKRYKN